MCKPSVSKPAPIFFLIYQTTNSVNGKIYIGKHKTANIDDGYLGSGTLLKRAIEKYGKECFSRKILFIFDNETDMNAKEREIVNYDFCSRDDVYNICEGGMGGWSYVNRTGINNAGKNMEVIGKKISSANKGKPNPEFVERTKQRHRDGLVNYATRKGHTISESHRVAISEAAKKKIGKTNSQYGTCWINDGNVDKKVDKKDLEYWVSLGFAKGRIKAEKAERPSSICKKCEEPFVQKTSVVRDFCSKVCSLKARTKHGDGLSAKERNTISKRVSRERLKPAP